MDASAEQLRPVMSRLSMVRKKAGKAHKVWSLDAHNIRARFRGKDAVRDAVRDGGRKKKHACSEVLCPGVCQLHVHAKLDGLNLNSQQTCSCASCPLLSLQGRLIVR